MICVCRDWGARRPREPGMRERGSEIAYLGKLEKCAYRASHLRIQANNP